ncbi:uncharacterized protein CANTADRAFT_20566 [Suhomyces tanzawaensis NRRL Y-17324]|uniref:Uncharacterized protein n=1 Tax=Suhomyces tanzawaensis NRRL Y-17324 TaxID=984487 RepID=A0A1E4SNB7_9ASCO|nr:uncharacterized protein CANTADRAFT_20566 [Suhomyces tanzawaensis NRRL Y-17324]ODV81019.1 hypothetical protein CANTADRAFT_20566 [Suhomyces tanzawaensis NRRL Y-17324]
MSLLRLVVILPFLLAYHLGTCCLVFFLLESLSPREPSTIIYQKTVILALILPAITYVLQFCHDIFTLGTGACQNFNKFYFPITQELLKFGVLYVVSSMHLINFKQLSIFIFITNSLELVQFFQLLSTLQYESKYKKFLQLHDVWVNQDLYKNKYSLGNKKEVEELFNNIIGSTEMEKRESVTSYNSDETLINQHISFNQLPSTFNLNNKESSSTVPKTDNTASMPIDVTMAKSDSHLSNFSTRRVTNYKSCYDFVDKLYSVSPKNTYHLNTATAIAAFDQYSGDQQLEQDDSLEYDPLAEIRSINENIDDQNVLGTDSDGSNGGTSNWNSQTYPKMNFAEGAGFEFSQDGNTVESDRHSTKSKQSTLQMLDQPSRSTKCACSPNRFISFVNWFSWLLPPFLPIHYCQKIHPKRKEAFPLLKQKLSTYHMERAFSILGVSTYGSLEEGISSSISEGANPYERFKYFVGYYFDYSMDTNSQLISIDPMFVRFGILSRELSTFILILNSVNQLAWTAISFFTLANFVISFSNEDLFTFQVTSFLTCITIILGLFKLNFLKSENCPNFKLIILFETIINLFFLVLYGVTLVTK